MDDKSVYVYKLFFNFKDEAVVDRFLPVKDIVTQTILFVKDDAHRLPNEQADLAKILQDLKIEE